MPPMNGSDHLVARVGLLRRVPPLFVCSCAHGPVVCPSLWRTVAAAAAGQQQQQQCARNFQNVAVAAAVAIVAVAATIAVVVVAIGVVGGWCF